MREVEKGGSVVSGEVSSSVYQQKHEGYGREV